MKALIVYESMFGNTRDIALAIGDGVSEAADVEVVEVGLAPDVIPPDLDLLIAGGPTHQFGMSRTSSREQARNQASGAQISYGRGIREWLDDITVPDRPLPVATFDTTMEKPRLLRYLGRASRSIAKHLERKGCAMRVPPESFLVGGGNGPLVEGELERARQWARETVVRASNQD